MAVERQRPISNIINQYSNRLYRFIRGRVSSNEDAEDILQDVWYQLSRVVELDSIEQMSGWLFRVARNRITDGYRKRKADVSVDEEKGEEGEGFNFKEILMAETVSPEEENLKEIFWEELFKALDELPANQKDVFVWNELEDQTFQEISDRTGVNIKTLISRKRYAVQHLRKRMAEVYGEFFDKEIA